MFARNGNPEVLYTDNVPPFNGGEYHDFQLFLKKEGICHKPNQSGEDPEANSLAESFMKNLKKIWHTARTGILSQIFALQSPWPVVFCLNGELVNDWWVVIKHVLFHSELVS